jgi:uncharacterized protein
VKGEDEEMPFPPLESAIGRDLTVEELLVGIVHALVDDRSEVQVTSKARVSGRIFQVTVAPSDVGKIIGKNGRTATSIRGVLSAMGVAAKMRYGLDIVSRR